MNNLQSYVDSIIEKHQIPALSVALWNKNQLFKAAAGTLNVNTGVEAPSASI